MNGFSTNDLFYTILPVSPVTFKGTDHTVTSAIELRSHTSVIIELVRNKHIDEVAHSDRRSVQLRKLNDCQLLQRSRSLFPPIVPLNSDGYAKTLSNLLTTVSARGSKSRPPGASPYKAWINRECLAARHQRLRARKDDNNKPSEATTLRKIYIVASKHAKSESHKRLEAQVRGSQSCIISPTEEGCTPRALHDSRDHLPRVLLEYSGIRELIANQSLVCACGLDPGHDNRKRWSLPAL